MTPTVSKEEEAYRAYVRFCESVDVKPASFENWKMYGGRDSTKLSDRAF
jgi:hypothetical protein